MRLPRELLEDLDAISNILHIHKSEWIKKQLAEDVLSVKMKLLEDASRLRNAGILSESEFGQFSLQLKKSLLRR